MRALVPTRILLQQLCMQQSVNEFSGKLQQLLCYLHDTAKGAVSCTPVKHVTLADYPLEHFT